MRGKILFGFIITLLAIITIGYYSYRSLSGLVNSLNLEARPNSKLLNLKELTLKLGQAEASVQGYSITGNPQSLNPYYQSIVEIDGILLALNILSFSDTTQINLLDSLENLLESEFRVLNKVIDLKKDDETRNLIDLLLANIRNIEFEQPEIVAESSIQTDTLDVESPISLTEEDQTQTEEIKPKKRSIFQRLFGSKKKRERELALDSINNRTLAVSDTIKEDLEIENNSIVTPTVSQPNPDLQAELTRTVTRLQRARESEENELIQRELAYFNEKEAVALSIKMLLVEFESIESIESQHRAELAESLQAETLNQIALIVLSTFFIMGILLVIVFRDIKQSNQQKVRLRQAKLKAEKLAKVKQDFLSNMSHEIRTPMNAVLGFAEQLDNTALNTDQKKFLSVIKNSSHHLLFLINDVLDYAKLDAGKLKFENIIFAPAKILNEVILYFEQQAASNSIYLKAKIDKSVPDWLKGDPTRLKQILINLIGNAVKFTEKGGVKVTMNVKINLEIAEIILSVTDTGMGIPTSKQKHIFQNFSQADSSITRRYGGSGLGLAISKKLIELQGGEISLKSKVGEGSTFSFKIPYKVASGPISIDSDVNKESNIDLTKHSFLIVDDEKYNRELFSVMIGKWGAKVVLVENGLQAIEELKRNQYDMVLMDLHMPEMDGFETTRIVKETFGMKTPILALTATASQERLEEFNKIGMDGIILKPITEAELKTIILSTLRKSKHVKKEKPGYDLTELEQIGRKDPDFLVNMIQLFIKNSKQGVKEMEMAYKQKNWKKLSLHAHKMIPPCRHLNLTAVVDNLKSIELHAEDESAQKGLQEKIAVVKSSLIKINKMLAAEIEETVN